MAASVPGVAEDTLEEKPRKLSEGGQRNEAAWGATTQLSRYQQELVLADLRRFRNSHEHHTMANTACYDARAECIRLPQAADGRAVLEGTIVDAVGPSPGPPGARPGKLLLAEIVEIVILGEDGTPLAPPRESPKWPPLDASRSEGWAANIGEHSYVEFERERRRAPPAEAASVPGTRGEETRRKEERRREIQAVMRDPSLDRREKQRRLALIKAQHDPTRAAREDGAEDARKTATAAAGTTPPGGAAPWRKSEGNDVRNEAQMPAGEMCRRLQANDPALIALALEGRRDAGDDWERMFRAVERNTCLTSLSLVDCGLTDDALVPLVLALVENETLVLLDLSGNPGVTKTTGKLLLKVLKQSNPVLKRANVDGTSIPAKTTAKLAELLAGRDDAVARARIQEARREKIEKLLAFDASDEAGPGTRRLSPTLREIDVAGDWSAGSVRKKQGKKQPPCGDSVRSRGSGRTSTSSRKIDAVGDQNAGAAVRKKGRERQPHRGSVGTAGSGNSSRNYTRVMNKRITLKSAADMIKMGECPECGEKLYEKTMFKTIPLNVPGKVDNGRCLLCASDIELQITSNNN